MDKKVSELILENNHQFIIANKPAGMPVQGDKTGDSSLIGILEAYCKAKLHLITRLDRPVSGLVLLSKKSSAHKSFREQQDQGKILKSYYAIVEGKLEKDLSIENYVGRDPKRMKAFISEKEKEGFEKAQLEAKVIKALDNYTILELAIYAGKFHQIRSQLAHTEHSIKGDVKYGARRKNPDRSIYLHAHSLNFKHPVSKVDVSFSALPDQNDSLWKLVPPLA